jgi:hypothetical protein
VKGGGQPSAALSVGSRAVGKRKTLGEIGLKRGPTHSDHAELAGWRQLFAEVTLEQLLRVSRASCGCPSGIDEMLKSIIILTWIGAIASGAGFQNQELPMLAGYRLGTDFDVVGSSLPCVGFTNMAPIERSGAEANFKDVAETARKCTPVDSVSLHFASDTLRIIGVMLTRRSLTSIEYWNSVKESLIRSLGQPDSVTTSRTAGLLTAMAHWSDNSRTWRGFAEFARFDAAPLATDLSRGTRGHIVIALCRSPGPAPLACRM